MADVLVFAPHPDDAEIYCGATIASHVRRQRSVAIVDATRGELASRGTPELRAVEALAAARTLGVQARENLELPDGGVPGDSPEARLLVAAAIRRHRPTVVLCNAAHARHSDHIALAQLVRAGLKTAALHRVRVPGDHAAHSGARLFFYEAELPLADPFLVAASEADWQCKIEAMACYRSQLHQPGVSAPATVVGDARFGAWIEARARTWGYAAGAAFAEAFIPAEALRVEDLLGL